MPAPAFNYPPAKKKNKLLFVILGILGILVVGGGVYAALNFVNFGGNNVMKMVKHLEDAGMTCEPVDTVDKFWDSYGEEGRKNLNDAQEAKAEKVYNRYSDQYYECYESDDTQQESPKDVMNPDYLLESLDDVFWRSLFSRSVQETCNSQDSESRDVQQVKEIDFEYLAMNRSVTIEGYISQDVRDKLKEAGVVLEEDVSACSYYEDSSE